jgi:uncharacterized protein (TIGR02145 family)
MKKAMLLYAGLAFIAFSTPAQTVTDFDGNTYQTVIIGSQIWMQENLKTTHYADGSAITLVNSPSGWVSLSETDKAYCYYNDDSASYADTYGALYNWAAAMNGADSSNTIPSNVQGVCPNGWHLPSDAEWHALVLYLDPSAVLSLTESNTAGGKMKEADTLHWNTNTGGTNESGFTGLPGGRRLFNGSFTQLTFNAMWWSTTVTGASVIDRTLYYCFATIDRGPADKTVGYAVRCLCDSTASRVNEINFNEDLRIYPNPATDIINIDCASQQGMRLCIYNVIGEPVLQKEITANDNKIDISRLLKGVYIIRISGDSFTVQQKLIKQ